MAESPLHKQQMPAYLDKEVSSADRDKFGHAHLSRSLSALLEDDRHRPPYSVGLLGKWGTGKSTVKEIYLHNLKNDETKNGVGIKRRDRIYTVTFNAWKYGGETDIRKSLFRHIFLEIGGTPEEADQDLFKTVATTESKKKTFRELCAEFSDQYALGLIIVVLFALLFLGIGTLMAYIFGLEDAIAQSAGLLTSGGIVALLVHKFFSSLTPPSARKPVQLISGPSQTIEEFENLFLKQIRKFKKKGFRSCKGKNVHRIVVFVDDLDRLPADEMVSGLDGIRSLMEIASHEMSDGTGLVFVISCDEERVAEALSNRRAYSGESEVISKIQDARRYLDRIFQFRLEIPPFPKRDMRNFVLNLLETEYLTLHADLRKRGIDTQKLVDKMIHPAVQSPRNAIQIINLFAQSWWLGVLREHAAVGSENPGGLGEGVITHHPFTLAIFCVIRTDFPDFYQALQRKPRVFGHFIDRCIRPKPVEPLPAEIREELTLFAVEVSEENRWEVKPQHRGLRQFMSHTQDIRRPYSLQPFLALSQDPVSRKHGDKAVPIEEALRTSDVVALLSAVGLTGSTAEFPPDVGTLIADLLDDLRTETPTIQDNIAFTVAQIYQRIPEKDRQRVLGLVAHRAADSETLRWRIGPSKLHPLVPYVQTEELQALGRSLIEDITGGDETKVFLSSSERPSLREGCDLIETAAAMVLEVMEKTDLPSKTQHQFGQWLLHRTVKVAGQSDQIPLSWLEQELLAHEDIVLPLIRGDYPRIILEELGREQPEALDLTVVTSRVSTVFDYFFEQGTSSRVKLWDHLKDFAGLRQLPLAELAFSKFVLWHDDADAETAHEVFAALGGHLIQNEDDPDKWYPEDTEKLRNMFADVAEALKSFSADGILNMVKLAQVWSETTAGSRNATRIHFVIAEQDSEQWEQLNEQWTERLFTNLPEACQDALFSAAKEEDAPEGMREQIASSLSSLEGLIEFDDHKIAALSRLLRLLDESLLRASPFAEYLTRFIDDIENLTRQGHSDYIIPKVRTLSGNLHKLPRESARQLLDSFQYLQPHFLSIVYDEFSEKWPVPESEGGINFSGQHLFDVGISALENLGQSDEAVQLLKSLDSLHRRRQLDQPTNQDALVAAAYELWTYAPETAGNIAERYPKAKRTSEQLYGLVVKISEDNGDNRDRLLEVLVSEVARANAEDTQAVTEKFLSLAPPTDGSPDPALALWTVAVSCNDPQILVDTLIGEDINDDQSIRLYNHILNNLEHLRDEHFFRIFRETLSADEGREKTAEAVVKSIKSITEQLLTSDNQQRALCEAALDVFSEIPSLERKAELSKACTPFGLKNVIVDGQHKENLPEEDMEIIEKYTGKISGKD